MKKIENKNITTFDELLDNKYGKRGAEKREKWEQEFEAFRLGVFYLPLILFSPALAF